MSRQVTLYTRRECCLCEEMKGVLRQVAERHPLTIEEIEIDSSPELQEKYGNEVPVLFVNGRKAFKFRMTAKELERKLRW